MSKAKYIGYKESLGKAIAVMRKLNTLTCPIVKGKKFLGVVSYYNAVKKVMKEIKV
jgi:predicted transcriptional regulator